MNTINKILTYIIIGTALCAGVNAPVQAKISNFALATTATFGIGLAAISLGYLAAQNWRKVATLAALGSAAATAYQVCSGNSLLNSLRNLLPSFGRITNLFGNNAVSEKNHNMDLPAPSSYDHAVATVSAQNNPFSSPSPLLSRDAGQSWIKEFNQEEEMHRIWDKRQRNDEPQGASYISRARNPITGISFQLANGVVAQQQEQVVLEQVWRNSDQTIKNEEGGNVPALQPVSGAVLLTTSENNQETVDRSFAEGLTAEQESKCNKAWQKAQQRIAVFTGNNALKIEQTNSNQWLEQFKNRTSLIKQPVNGPQKAILKSRARL